MITLEEFIGMNGRFAGENFLTQNDERTKNVWERNLEIAKDIEAAFYTRYDMELMTPQVGDIVEYSSYGSVYKHALVESVSEYGTLEICQNGHSFTDGLHISTSGGAFELVHESCFEFAGYEDRTFWTWGSFGSGANQGIEFKIRVKKFIHKKILYYPTNMILFRNQYYMENGYGKVQILDDSLYSNILQSFVTIKAFNAFANYVGLTYRKCGNQYIADQFIKDVDFWSLNQLPQGSKPIHAMSNGSIVVCYVHKQEGTITIYRPNPNAKEVYQPLSLEESRKYRMNPLGV